MSWTELPETHITGFRQSPWLGWQALLCYARPSLLPATVPFTPSLCHFYWRMNFWEEVKSCMKIRVVFGSQERLAHSIERVFQAYGSGDLFFDSGQSSWLCWRTLLSHARLSLLTWQPASPLHPGAEPGGPPLQNILIFYIFSI